MSTRARSDGLVVLATLVAYIAVATAGKLLLHRRGIGLHDPRILWAGIPHMALLALLVVLVGRRFGPLVRREHLRPERTGAFLLPVLAGIQVVVLLVGALVRGLFSPVLVAAPVLTALSGLAEEGMFRRNLVELAGERPGWRAALGVGVLSAGMFAALHLVNLVAAMPLASVVEQAAGAFGFGLVAAVLYLATRNLVALAAWHMSVDLALMSSLAGTFYSPGVIGVVIDVVVVVAVLQSLRILWRRVRHP